MPKIFKSKNNDLLVNIPTSIAKGMELADGDDVEFIMHDGRYCIFAKKEAGEGSVTRAYRPPNASSSKMAERGPEINSAELAFLKKLDTIRYGERTESKVKGILSERERALIRPLLDRGIIFLYSKKGEGEPKYGINKVVYDKFLFGKREKTAAPVARPAAAVQKARSDLPEEKPQKKWMDYINTGDNQSHFLETNGYVVLNTEMEARELSSHLEDSIRHGMVVGTRAFNKKFYVLLRGFISKNAPKILKCLDKSSVSVSEISKETSIDEDGIRAILYVLSESGDVSEVRRDVFRIA